jgi:hypothetical protein
MNDPELDDAIGDAAKDVEQDPYEKAEKEEEEEEADFLDPRYFSYNHDIVVLLLTIRLADGGLRPLRFHL